MGLILFVSAAAAAQIDFTSTASLTAEVNRTSTGQPFDGNYLMDLGVFDNGFTPSADNIGAWASHWHTAQRIAYNTTFRAFSGSFVVSSNAAPFTLGKKGFLWVFNPRGVGGEWVLLSSSNWLWPDALDTAALPSEWPVSGASEVYFGQAHVSPGTMMISAPAGSALPPMTSYSQWAAAKIPAGGIAALPGGDPDNDGIQNRFEFAYGFNPLVKNSAPLVPQFHPQIVSGINCLTLTLPRQTDRMAWYAVEASNDLLTWSRTASDVRTVTSTIPDFTFCDKLPLGARAHRFLRLVLETY